MATIFKFPTESSVFEKNLKRGLRKLDMPEIMEGVYSANMEILDVENCPDPSQYVEFFHVSDYPGLYLVDVSNPNTNTVGLFVVDPETFELLKIASEPLVHFTDE